MLYSRLCAVWLCFLWLLRDVVSKGRNNSMLNAVIMLHSWSLHFWHIQAMNHLYLFCMHIHIHQIANTIIKQYTALYITSEIHNFYVITQTEVMANQKPSWVCYLQTITSICYNLLWQNREFLNNWSCINLHKYCIFTGLFS